MFFVLPAFSQQRWERNYGGTNTDRGYSVQQTTDGGYIIAGSTNSFGAGYDDVYLIKTNASGDTLWTRTFGGWYNDNGNSVKQTSDGGYIVAGSTQSFGTGDCDVYLIKTNASGDTLWTRHYGGREDQYGQSVCLTRDSSYVIAGVSALGGWYLVKTNASGDTLWTRVLNTGLGWARSIQQTLDGGFIIAGDRGLSNPVYVYLIKTNASGDTLWTKTYGGTFEDGGASVQQTTDGGYIIAGSTSSFGAGLADVWLIKTNALGDTLWSRTYGGTRYDYGWSVQQTTDGGYIIAGSTYSFGPGNPFYSNVYLIKTNATGDTLWSKIYGGADEEWGYSIQQTTDGGYIITGYTTSFSTGGADVWLIKTNASGDTLWTKTLGGTHWDIGYSVRQTSDGGYILAGFTESFADTLSDVYLIKTDANGNVGVEVSPSRESRVMSYRVFPNPFTSFATLPGHEAERFSLYEISGRRVGIFRGDRVGEGLSAGVYFLKPESGDAKPFRIVKLR